MQKRTREILALALLVVLGIAVLCAMGWYILVGHNWNVAASNIDDTIGQMEGYTVVLFEGTRDKAAIELREAEQKEAEQRAVQQEQQGPADNGDPAMGGDAQNDRSSSSSAPGAQQDDHAADATLDDKLASNIDIEVDGALTIDDLAQEYRDKGATVYRLSMFDKKFYSEPILFSKGDRRIGVFFLGSPARPAQALIGAKMLARQESDFNIVITDDSGLEAYSLPPIQLIINDDQSNAPEKGYYRDSVYCVDTPYIGEIEAVIISPSGVISSKTLGSSE